MRKLTVILANPKIDVAAKRQRACWSPALLALVLCGCHLAAIGQTVTWTDADKNESWADSGNWDMFIVPGIDCTTCDVVIPFLFSGNFTMDDISPLTLDNITVGSNTVIIMPDGASITVNGNTLGGYVEMNNSGTSGFTTLTINGNVTYTDALQGFGIQMFNASLIGGSGTLTNEGTISYGRSFAGSPQGLLGSGNSLTVQNSNIISSSGTGSVLELNPNAAWTNGGTIEAEAGGNVNITPFASGGKITQLGSGQIVANGGTVELGAITIINGILSSSNGGTITTQSGNTPVLSNLTMSGQYLIGGDSAFTRRTTLTGTITNNGLIDLLGTGIGSLLFINSPVTLTGTGSGVSMGGSVAAISGSGILTNQQTISGAGAIKVATLVNQGTISASASNGDNTLTVTPGSGGVTNTGTIDAALVGSTIEISGGKVTNTGGTIASGAGVALLDGGVTVVGGTVAGNNGSYVEGKSATLDGTSSPVSVTGLFNVLDGDVTFLKGTINGAGNIFVEGVTTPTSLHVKGTTIIEGGVAVDLGNDSPNSQLVGDGSTLSKITFQGSTLEGSGLVSRVKVTIDQTSTVECLLNGTPFEFDSTSSALIQGTLSNPTGCTLKFDNNLLNVNSTTGTLTGGTLNLSGPLLQPSNIQTLNGTVILNDSVAEIETLSGANALNTLTSIGSKGALTIGPNLIMLTAGALSNAGALTVDAQGFFDPGGDVTQTGGVSSISGALNLPAGGSLTATGGTVEGNNGTFNGSVTVGNQIGGATVNLVLGPTKKLPGQLTVTNNLTLNPTAMVTVPIISSTQGSGYGAINVTDTATLGGTLNITRPTGYIPPIGTFFTIIDASGAVISTFPTVKGLSINNNEHFTITYNAKTVTLTTVSGPSGELVPSFKGTSARKN